MKTQIISIAVLLNLLILSGCVKDDTQETPLQHPIKVNVAVDETRAVPTTIDELKISGSFIMDAFLDAEAHDYVSDPTGTDPAYHVTDLHQIPDKKVKYSSASWSLESDFYWMSNDMTRFWCRWPADADVDAAAEGKRTITTAPASTSTSMVFEYLLPTHVAGSDATNQKDILFAYSERNYPNAGMYGETGEFIDIHFNHPLSRVMFCISPDDATYDLNLSIKSITVKGVYSGGSCTFNGKGKISPTGSEVPMFAWDLTSYSIPTDGYSQDYNVTFGTSAPSGWENGTYQKSSKTYKLYSCTNSFMMIPQTLGTGAELEVVFHDNVAGDDITRKQSIAGDIWKPGHYYKYKIGATAIGRTVSMIVILDEWGHFEDKLLI